MNNGEFSGARLGRMRDVMAGHVKHGDVPGIVTLVSRRGEVHVDAIGTNAFGGSASMRRDTIFRIASVTKPIVAAAAMILVEECALRLDEPVDPWLPELVNRQVLRAIEGPIAPMFCASDDPEHALICDRSSRCTVNLLWVRVRDAVTSAVDSMTLADLVPLPGTPAVTTPALTGAVTPS